MSIQDLIDGYAKLCRSAATATTPSTYEIIARLGHGAKPGQPLPSKYRRGRQRECFKNAALLALEHDELCYVEGYASRATLPLLIEHAWCLDPGGDVIDPTWEASAADEYAGLVIDRAELREALLATQRYGVVFAYRPHQPLVDRIIQRFQAQNKVPATP